MPDATRICEFNYHQAGFPRDGDAEFAFTEAFVETAPTEATRAEATPAEATLATNPKGNNV
jgi:hypothetical protein